MNNDTEDQNFFNETCAISLALKNFEKLELKGGLIRLNGKIIAFTLGSRANEDTFIVHIEKADYTITGSYQMINNQFAINNFEGIKYINREEDLGIEGLRKAKLSYNPIILADNYSATVKQEVAMLRKANNNDLPQIIKLWNVSFLKMRTSQNGFLKIISILNIQLFMKIMALLYQCFRCCHMR